MDGTNHSRGSTIQSLSPDKREDLEQLRPEALASRGKKTPRPRRTPARGGLADCREADGSAAADGSTHTDRRAHRPSTTAARHRLPPRRVRSTTRVARLDRDFPRAGSRPVNGMIRAPRRAVATKVAAEASSLECEARCTAWPTTRSSATRRGSPRRSTSSGVERCGTRRNLIDAFIIRPARRVDGVLQSSWYTARRARASSATNCGLPGSSLERN